MFLDILSNIQKTFPDDDISKLKYYFDRDIKKDKDEHNSQGYSID